MYRAKLTHMSESSTKSRRRWFRFSLRGLLILVAVLCIWFSYEKNRVTKQARITAQVRDLGGDVFFGYRFDSSGKPTAFSKRKVPGWITDLVGEDFFLTDVTINFDNEFGKRPKDRSKAIGSQVTNEALSLLDDVRDVTSLLLASNPQLTDECLAHVDHLKQLRVLRLNQTNVTGSGLRHIQSLRNLEGLTLSDTPLTDEGLVYLKGLSRLEWLRLGDTEITDEGLSHLSSLSSLEALELYNTKITDQGLKYLRNLKGLKRLSLRGTATTAEGRQNLQEAIPTCTISWQ